MNVDTAHRLFNAPGPKGQKRAKLYSALSLVIILGLISLALINFGAHGGLDPEKWLFIIQPESLKFYGEGLVATLKVTAVAGVFGLVLGSMLAIMRVSPNRALSRTVGAYVEVTRSLPTLLVLYFTLLLLPYYGITMPIFWQLVAAMTIPNASMIAEILRGCILALPKGQMEAGLALGATRGTTMRTVIFPQAFTDSMPALIAQLIFLLKSSTLGYVISYNELLFKSRVIGEFSEEIVTAMIFVVVIFLVVNVTVGQALLFLYGRYERSQRGVAPREKRIAHAEPALA